MKNNRHFARLVIALVVVLSFTSLNAQDYVDLLKIEYGVSPNNEFKDFSGNSDVRAFIADIILPISVNDRRAIVAGFLYESFRVRATDPTQDFELYTLNLKLILNQTFNEKLSAKFIVLPKYSSDLKGLGKYDLQLGVAVLFDLIKNDNFSWQFGGYYNAEIFGPFFVPIFGFYYQLKKWEVIAIIPQVVDINYQVSEKLRTGLKFSGIIKSFHLNESVNPFSEYIHLTNNEIGPYLMYSIGNFNLLGQVAMTVGRNYQTYEMGDKVDLAITVFKFGDERTRLNPSFKDGLTYKTGVIYRFHTKK